MLFRPRPHRDELGGGKKRKKKGRKNKAEHFPSFPFVKLSPAGRTGKKKKGKKGYDCMLALAGSPPFWRGEKKKKEKRENKKRDGPLYFYLPNSRDSFDSVCPVLMRKKRKKGRGEMEPPAAIHHTAYRLIVNVEEKRRR